MPPPKSSSRFCCCPHSTSSSKPHPLQPPSPSYIKLFQSSLTYRNPFDPRRPSRSLLNPSNPFDPRRPSRSLPNPSLHVPRRSRPLFNLRPGSPTSFSPSPPQLLQAGGHLLQLLLCQRISLRCPECQAPATRGQASRPRGFLRAARRAGAAPIGSGRPQAMPGEAGLQFLLQLLQLGLLPPRRLILQLLLEVS